MRLARILIVSILHIGQALAADANDGGENGLDEVPEAKVSVTQHQIEMAYYEAGHMMYIHQPSLVKYKEDLAKFIRDSH